MGLYIISMAASHAHNTSRRLTNQLYFDIMAQALDMPDAALWATRNRFAAAWAVATGSRQDDVLKLNWWNLFYDPYPTSQRDPAKIGPSQSAAFSFFSARGKHLKTHVLDQESVVRGLHFEEDVVGALACLAVSEPFLLSGDNLKGFVMHAPTGAFAKELSSSMANLQTRTLMQAVGIDFKDQEVLEGDKHVIFHAYKKLAADNVEGLDVTTEDKEHFLGHQRTMTREIYMPKLTTLMHLIGGWGPRYKSQHFLGRQVVLEDSVAWGELKGLAMPGLQGRFQDGDPDLKSVLTALSALVEVFLQDSVLQIDFLGDKYFRLFPQLQSILRHRAWGGFADLVRKGHQDSLDRVDRIAQMADNPDVFIAEGVRAAMSKQQGGAVVQAPLAVAPVVTHAALGPERLRFSLIGRSENIAEVLGGFEAVRKAKKEWQGGRGMWDGDTNQAKANSAAFKRFEGGLYAKFLELQAVGGRDQAILQLTADMQGPLGKPNKNNTRLQTICCFYQRQNNIK